MVSSTRRRPVMTTHRARPTPARDERKGDQMEGYEQEYKKEYIEFINKLMARMKMDGIERMLEAALNETK